MLHPDLLRSFLAVVEAGSFTGAARALEVRQSTVSQHLQRLEGALGRALLLRDTHRVALTPDGDALVGFARAVVAAHERLDRFVAGTALRGRIRLGASEDFTLSVLPAVLARFQGQYPSVDLQLTVALSAPLYAGFDAGELDVVLVKRRPGDLRGEVAWTDRLAWVGRPGFVPDAAKPLPLVVYPPPSVTRGMAVAALEAAGRSWLVACTSGSLTGLRAATAAGLGVAPHCARLAPPGLVVLPEGEGLPALGVVEFVVLGPGRQHVVASALIEALLASVGEVGG